ncbi:MAG TPA: hypothetical protein VMZ29_07840 [Candidatus Bathyarchaeia archaeon]|nr:hypothetical protein [Candidatus Bathyarchaeia archaeon]
MNNKKEKKEENLESEEELTKAQKRIRRQETRALKRKEREEKRKARKWYHPLRVLRGIGLFFLYLIKIIFFPYVYAFWKLRDSIKFLSRNDPEDLDRDLLSIEDGDEIPLGYIDEKGFLRSLPMFYFIAGTLGGIIAIFIFFDFMDDVWYAIATFFKSFTWAAFVDILDVIFVQGIWFALTKIWFGIKFAAIWLFTGGRFWIPLTVLIVFGVLAILIAVIFREADFSGKFLKKVKAFFVTIFTFPRILWKLMKKGYMGFQKGISHMTYTERKLKYMNKRFFYRVVYYSMFITIWIIISVFITVLVTELNDSIHNYYIIYPIAVVIIGFVNGILLLTFLSWFVGALSGEKYITNIEKYNSYKEDMKKLRQEKKETRKMLRNKTTNEA